MKTRNPRHPVPSAVEAPARVFLLARRFDALI